MRNVFCYLLSLSGFFAGAQMIKTVDPIVDETLQFPAQISIDRPVYHVSENCIIYQEKEKLIRIAADAKTFRFPKYDRYNAFALDKNGIYFRGKLVETDTVGFKILAEIRNEDYTAEQQIIWKNAKVIYNNDKPVTGIVDVATFAPATYGSEFYFKDKDFLYYKLTKIEGSDAKTAGESRENIINDKNHVYIGGKIATYKGLNLKAVNDVFAKTSSHVVNYNLQEQQGIDASTLTGLSRRYAKDKNNLYYGTEKSILKNLNLKNIRVWDQVNRAFFTDGVKVYYGLNNVEPFDPKTFGMLPHSDFCFDKNGIYEKQYNPKTEKVDNIKFPFKYGSPVSANNTFITKNSRYVIYEKQAYDPWDKKHFNLTAEQVKLAKEDKLEKAQIDPAYLNIFDYKLSKTSGKIYVDGKPTDADAETFMRIGYLYKDKNHVYAYDREKLQVIDGIDAASSESFGQFVKDKNAIYMHKSKIVSSEDVELLAISTGYRQGCGLDTTPGSNYYIFRNNEGFWLALISDDVRIKFLGKDLEASQQKQLGL